ncbi:hypothetical protein ACFFX0_05955 [Citricoccus parietis]|uniref:Uncharacterized protein n=1 Tax=Citricoccus parietis TaxID=592307 RepID=A0ABV5FVQ6_9MICC
MWSEIRRAEGCQREPGSAPPIMPRQSPDRRIRASRAPPLINRSAAETGCHLVLRAVADHAVSRRAAQPDSIPRSTISPSSCPRG